jgi:adenylate kinase family enzyme
MDFQGNAIFVNYVIISKRTSNQAALLENQLSGYEPPSKLQKIRAKRMSRIDIPKPPTSGIDIIIRLEINDELALRRALGRRIDPQTGNIYHLEYNPPPVDQQLINERLIALPSDSNAHIQHALAVYTNQRKNIQNFYKPFNIERCMDVQDMAIGDIFHQLDDLFREISESKEKEAERKRKEEEERLEKLKEEELLRKEREEKLKVRICIFILAVNFIFRKRKGDKKNKNN